MQILPDSFMSQMEDMQSLWPEAAPADAGFAKTLTKLLSKSEDDGSSLDPDSAAADDAAWQNAMLAGAPYNPTPDISSPFAPQPVRFTAQEAERLAEAMRDDGVPAKALAALMDAGRMPGGATMDLLLKAAQEALKTNLPTLSDVEQAHLLTLSQKAAGQDGRNLFAQGTAKAGLDGLLKGLDGQSSEFTITRDEMSALIKALNLSEGAGKNLLKAFGNDSSLRVSGKELASMLAPAKAEVEATASATDTLLTSFQQHIGPVYKDAAKREEMERMAGMREDRAVAQARTLILDKATQAAPGRDPKADPDKQTRAIPRQNEQQATAKLRDAAAVPPADTRFQDSGNTRPRAGTEDSGHDAQPGDSRARTMQRQSSGRNTDSSMMRTAMEHSSPAAGIPVTVAQGVDTVTPSPLSSGAEAGQSLSSRAMEQVEQAILTAHKNGTQRLEVALSPESLGSMTLVLTTRHGEVSAVIRPERAETAALIAQQADQIRAELEHQGFKVEKVDVQTQLADQQSQSWQGTDQHNAARDFSARTQELERLRLLGRGGEQLHTDTSELLARDMHISLRPASVAGQGLHLIA